MATKFEQHLDIQIIYTFCIHDNSRKQHYLGELSKVPRSVQNHNYSENNYLLTCQTPKQAKPSIPSDHTWFMNTKTHNTQHQINLFNAFLILF